MPLGNDMDLQSHVDGNDSGYVATSSDQIAASGFGQYVYSIDDQPNGIDVLNAPGIIANPLEQEIAVPGVIPIDAIRECQAVDPATSLPTGPFIQNPSYPN